MAVTLPNTILLALSSALLFAPGANAQEHAGHSPYTDMTDRAIKALSPEEVAGLRAGEGLGFALSAELNGLPGPKHALDMAVDLALTPAQNEALEDIRSRMTTEAQRLGTLIIDAETTLDRRFQHGHATAESVMEGSVEIGRLRGELRAVHLSAHLETVKILTPEQTAEYAHLRGYRTGGSDP